MPSQNRQALITIDSDMPPICKIGVPSPRGHDGYAVAKVALSLGAGVRSCSLLAGDRVQLVSGLVSLALMLILSPDTVQDGA